MEKKRETWLPGFYSEINLTLAWIFFFLIYTCVYMSSFSTLGFTIFTKELSVGASALLFVLLTWTNLGVYFQNPPELFLFCKNS